MQAMSAVLRCLPGLLVCPVNLLSREDCGKDLHRTDLSRLYLKKVSIQDHHIGMLSDLDRTSHVFLHHGLSAVDGKNFDRCF